MRNAEKDAKEMEERKRRLLDVGFALFSARSIESVSMQQIADTAGLGIATLYRYFPRKQEFVIAVGSERWKMIDEESREKSTRTGILKKSVKEQFSYFLESFIDLYREHRDLLCFNYDFNRYIQISDVKSEELRTHIHSIEVFRASFSGIYERGMQSGELRKDVTEEQMFSASVHLMLAAATRYAVGLVYNAHTGRDLEELELLKEMLIREYTV